MKLEFNVQFDIPSGVTCEPNIVVKRNLALKSYEQLRIILKLLDNILKRKGVAP